MEATWTKTMSHVPFQWFRVTIGITSKCLVLSVSQILYCNFISKRGMNTFLSRVFKNISLGIKDHLISANTCHEAIEIDNLICLNTQHTHDVWGVFFTGTLAILTLMLGDGAGQGAIVNRYKWKWNDSVISNYLLYCIPTISCIASLISWFLFALILF